MGKNPALAILAVLFVAGCPFFVTCHTHDELQVYFKGLNSLERVMVKYQTEFDEKVKFVQLQEAIDEIDKVMINYQGNAKNKLDQIRALNAQAKLTYANCVAPVFEWCVESNETFNLFITDFNQPDLLFEDKKIILELTINEIHNGLNQTTSSLTLLYNVQNLTAELENTFSSMIHNVHDDFGPDGFYGKEKMDMEQRLNQWTPTSVLSRRIVYVDLLFISIGDLIYGRIGQIIGFRITFIVTYGIENKEQWLKKKTYEERIEFINNFFKILLKKIEEATEIVKDIESTLEEDKSNLLKLSGEIKSAKNMERLLNSPTPRLQARFTPSITKVRAQCTIYADWHGHNAPFYQKIKSRARRAASTFCQRQRSIAEDMLAKSRSSNSTQMRSVINRMDCSSQ
ncbi:hypothetical protein KR026_003599 [Drosophila bipectinata]|nr:hypothetical protein KR026_003599 [Drosophila bipectinata]